MRIGIDIDNVIANFEEDIEKEYLEHGAKIIDISKWIDEGRYDWCIEKSKEFYKCNIERIATNFTIINFSDKYINKLKEDGNEIYIISGRDNGEYTNPYEMTKNWLEEHHIYYDKLILTDAYNTHAKTKKCKKNNIDIMIDDSPRICKDLQENNIKVLMMDRKLLRQSDCNIERVSSWPEIYDKISGMYKKQKINVILDTDTYNECDDQFALAYMLKSQDIFNIEAITVAPYSHNTYNVSVPEGQENSYNEILKICNWLDFDTTNKVFKGSMDYIQNGYNENNDAVNKIIQIALKNDKTYILAIGAITNVALAIKKEPKIINKIEIIWLGGHNLLSQNNLEYNFRQDVDAVKTVFECKVKLTLIPCKGVASNLMTSIYELEHYLKNKNELCDYLCDRFYNDGIHRIRKRRVIWDISAVAYLINKDWFETSQISCPNINNDTSYQLTQNNHNITIVSYLNSSKIYEDLFRKLGE